MNFIPSANKNALCMLLLFLAACGQEPDGDRVPDKKARVIVLCDASNSTTLLHAESNMEGRLEKLKTYVKRVPKWYSFESQVLYYPVSDNLVSEQLGPTVCYDIRMRSQLEPEKEKADSFENKINNGIDSMARNRPSSCILLSIKRAINRFNELARGETSPGYSNELVIISDMLESCRVSDTAEIRMSVLNTARLNAAIQQFGQENPVADISRLHLTVKVIINSPWMGSRFAAIQQSWENWFYKLGIQKENLFFYTDDPNTPENPLLRKL